MNEQVNFFWIKVIAILFIVYFLVPRIISFLINVRVSGFLKAVDELFNRTEAKRKEKSKVNINQIVKESKLRENYIDKIIKEKVNVLFADLNKNQLYKVVCGRADFYGKTKNPDLERKEWYLGQKEEYVQKFLNGYVDLEYLNTIFEDYEFIRSELNRIEKKIKKIGNQSFPNSNANRINTKSEKVPVSPSFFIDYCLEKKNIIKCHKAAVDSAFGVSLAIQHLFYKKKITQNQYEKSPSFNYDIRKKWR